MVRPFSIIDVLALISSTRGLGTMPLFRLLRVASLLRVLKVARYASGLEGYLTEFQKRACELPILALLTPAIIAFSSVTVFCVEKPAGNKSFTNIVEAHHRGKRPEVPGPGHNLSTSAGLPAKPYPAQERSLAFRSAAHATRCADDTVCQAAERQGLQVRPPRSGQCGEKQSLTAE